MKISLKRFLALSLVLAAVFALGACSSPSPSATDTGGAAATATPKPADTSTGDDDAGGTDDVTEPAPASNYDQHMTISMTVLDAEKTGNTRRDAWFNEKFNVSWEFIPVTWGDWFEKVRAMVAGDNLPDLLWWDMKVNHTSEFRGWASQGAFREITGLEQWPAMQDLLDTLQSDEAMLTLDNKLFGWPVSRSNPEWLQNAYYPMFAYRRDWAQELGMYKEGDRYTYEEIFAMIDAVKEQDPGGNGAGNTFGITSEAWAFPGVFMEILYYSPVRDGYQKNAEGKYVPYFTTEAWRNELKFVAGMFRNGYIWKDQIAVGGSEGLDNFKAGRSFMYLGNNSPGWFGGQYASWLEAGTIDSTDDLAPMIALSPNDNETFVLTETEDYWTVTNFAYHVDDDKYNRIFDMWDWLWTEDGRAFRLAGIEGEDYNRLSNTEIEILWDKDSEGNWISPWQDTAANMYTPPAGVPGPNETTNMAGENAFIEIHQFIQTSPNYHVNAMNWALNTYDGEQYSTFGAFSSEVREFIIAVLASSEDVDTLVDEWLIQMEPKWTPVAAELDANF